MNGRFKSARYFGAAWALYLIPAEANAHQTETAVLAGGCYWGVESVFRHVKGVEEVVSGFAGGSPVRMDHGNSTGLDAAEAVRIRFDPSQVTYEQLLNIFFVVVHDPTQLNRQGPDVGERYRSAIFPQGAAQRATAERYLAGLRASGRFAKPIVTRFERGPFEAADQDQQNYVRRHPNLPYVLAYDLPKLRQMRSEFPALWKDD